MPVGFLADIRQEGYLCIHILLSLISDTADVEASSSLLFYVVHQDDLDMVSQNIMYAALDDQLESDPYRKDHSLRRD